MSDYPPFVIGRYGIRGLFWYGSMFASTVNKLGGDFYNQARRVYNFKKQGHSAELFRELVEHARSELGCAEIWVVPPSKVGEMNQLQKMFGVSILRTRSSEPRKYNHNAEIDMTAFEFPAKASGKVLLIDDIATTGLTLIQIEKALAEKSVSCVKFALGVNKKIIDPSSPDPATVERAYKEWRASRNIVEQEENEPDDVWANQDVSDLLQSLESVEDALRPKEDIFDEIIELAEDVTIPAEERLKAIVRIARREHDKGGRF